MIRSENYFLFILCLILISCANKNPNALIDRELFFGNPEKMQVRVSPDNKYLSYRAPVNGVMNLWAGPIDHPEKIRPVTNDTLRGVRNYMWTYKSGHILYLQDSGGDENWHIHLVNVENATDTDLTPFEEISGPNNEPLTDNAGKLVRPRADILNVSRDKPDEILARINLTEPHNMDVYRINLDTKESALIVEDDAFLQIVPDNNNKIRLATKTDPNGGQIVYKYKNGRWEEYFHVPQEDMLTFGFGGFNKTNDKVYMYDSRGRDKAAIYALNINTDDKSIIAEDNQTDIQGATVNPVTYEVDAYAVNYERTKWIALADNVKGDIKYLSELVDGELTILLRTNDDKNWIVAYDSPDQSVRYYNYDRASGRAKFLLSRRPTLDKANLSKTYPLEIDSRDGYKLISYMTIAYYLDKDGLTSKPTPMVLLVHGGPFGRDHYGFSSIHQWLANRGYVVLSVNYRGSTGYGKNFINIAAKEWGGKMHDDLIDAVNWAIEKKIADKEKVAIMGGSYGGYATLVGLTFTPDVFACGVDIVGPSNLNTLLATIPPYWKAMRDMFVHYIGDPATEEGKALLQDRSPLGRVDKISKPLLIGQGANDPRVRQSESDQIVEAMKKKNIPVTYILYPDEGHGFARPENNMSFWAVSEMFLAKHLGGRFQEIGDDFKGSSIKVVESGELSMEP